MFPGMAEKNNGNGSHRSEQREKSEVEGWLDGQGGDIFGIILIALVIYGIWQLFG